MPSSKRSNNTLDNYNGFSLIAKSPSAINEFLAFIPRPPRYANIRVYLIYHKGDLYSTLTKKFSSREPIVAIENEDASVLSITIKSMDQEQTTGYISILPGNYENFHRMITVSYSRFWNSAVKRLVHKSYPEAIPVFFKQEEIRSSLITLEESLGSDYRISISEVTMKRKRKKQRTLSRRFETDRLWTEKTITQVFDLAKERNQWFTSIQFLVEKQNDKRTKYKKVATGRIYKDGYVIYDLLHQEITQSLIAYLEEYAFNRFTLLQGRGMRERGYKKGIPIEIRYDQDLFEKKEEVQRFGSVIKTYPNSTKAIFHSNPYYHASVADFIDGSSFEIWILSSNKVMILPQAKSTEEAFERLIGHIFHEFREGNINEYAE